MPVSSTNSFYYRFTESAELPGEHYEGLSASDTTFQNFVRVENDATFSNCKFERGLEIGGDAKLYSCEIEGGLLCAKEVLVNGGMIDRIECDDIGAENQAIIGRAIGARMWLADVTVSGELDVFEEAHLRTCPHVQRIISGGRVSAENCNSIRGIEANDLELQDCRLDITLSLSSSLLLRNSCIRSVHMFRPSNSGGSEPFTVRLEGSRIDLGIDFMEERGQVLIDRSSWLNFEQIIGAREIIDLDGGSSDDWASDDRYSSMLSDSPDAQFSADESDIYFEEFPLR